MSKLSNRQIQEHAVKEGWVAADGTLLDGMSLYHWLYANSVSAPEADSAFGWQQTTTYRLVEKHGLPPLTGDTPPPAPPPRPEVVREPVREHLPIPRLEVIRATLVAHQFVTEDLQPIYMREVYDFACDYGVPGEVVDEALGWAEGTLNAWVDENRFNPILVQYEVMRQGYRPSKWEPLRLYYPMGINLPPAPEEQTNAT